jgi:membrane-associated PAP2 superfamily phosphatase
MQMKSLLAALALSTAMTVPVLAQAKTVNLTTTLKQYGGQGAYLAIYVTDPSGAYAGSLWMAGGKAKYYKHLSDWARFTGNSSAEVRGITGASVGAGRKLDLSMDLSDALFDAGYTLHIDAAVEDMRDSPNEIAVPLTNSGAGKAVKGRRYIANFQYGF